MSNRQTTTIRTAILASIAAAALLAVQSTTAQSPVESTLSPVPMIHVLQPGPATADSGDRAAPADFDAPPPIIRGAQVGLTIVPTFDSTITLDPNAVAIENAINTAIGIIQAQLTDPITVNIRFQKITSGLGQSSTAFFNTSYASFLAALKADAKTSDDATAIALLANVAANPVNGSTSINVKTANMRAVGLAAAVTSDGTIGLNTTITTPGSPGSSLTYNLIPVILHEVDEVLGLGSSLPSVSFSTIFPEDLYRYAAVNTRTFTITSSVLAFFSIDAMTGLAQFDNQNDGGDFGDWQSNPRASGVPPKVQDAFATPGANPAMSVEFTALDVIGYDRFVPGTAPSITSQPASQTIVSGSTATMSVTATGTAPLAYQWYVGTAGNTSTPVGTNSNSFTTPALTTTTSYWVRVSNGSGMADSNTATITVNVPPAITSQPANQVVKKGQTAQFMVAASGFPAPAYQWQVSTNGGSTWTNLTNGAPFSGVTTTTLTVSNTTLAMNGTRYRSIATNIVSSATSNAATLTVLGSSARADFDGEGKADLAVYRPSTGNWFIDLSMSNYTTFLSPSWGTASDIPVPGDYDGDGKADIAIFRPSTGVWYILMSSSNFTTFTSTSWGVSTDVPVPRDYDGDGKADIAVYRPSTGNWYVLQSSNAALLSAAWGTSTDTLVPGDYDGDGKADFAIYRPSTGAWYVLQSSTNFTTFLTGNWGAGGDLPEPGDYDGDGKTDFAIYRPSTGAWYMLQSSTNNSTFLTATWGNSTDVPVPGDFDGDGKADLAVYRPSTGAWFILQSSSNFTTFITQTWGTSTDMPLPSR